MTPEEIQQAAVGLFLRLTNMRFSDELTPRYIEAITQALNQVRNVTLEEAANCAEYDFKHTPDGDIIAEAIRALKRNAP